MTDRPYRLSDFDYTLPPELIAQHPAAQRRGARLLDGSAAQPQDRSFAQWPALLRAGDLLVCNDTRVMRARLFGRKASGGAVELLIERVLADGSVVAHLRASKKPAPGSRIALHAAPGHSDAPWAELLGRCPAPDQALFHLRLVSLDGADAHTLMARHGHLPLPPYITHTDAAEDAERYQSVWARHLGAVAAPTASLHLDAAMLDELEARGVARSFVTLHVGAGTFQPVKTDDLQAHTMHAEWLQVSAATQRAVAQCRARGGRVVALGTTSVRALESWALAHPQARDDPAAAADYSADTRLFITPGFDFRVVDALLTNFHLPQSTLLMLVSALAGYAHVRALYAHATAQRYRFFSYGDAMWLLRSATPQSPLFRY